MNKLDILKRSFDEWDDKINDNHIMYSKKGHFIHVGIANSGDGMMKFNLDTGKCDYIDLGLIYQDHKDYPDLHKITRKEMESLLN